MKLLIDAGNSRLKWAKLSTQCTFASEAIPHTGNTIVLLENLLLTHRPQQLVIVHVLGQIFEQQIQKLTTAFSISLLIVHSHSSAYGIRTQYQDASKLGADRFVAMLAAYQLYQQACIVIDCGTAITIDAVNHLGIHIGGIIFPGLQLCQNSLINKAQNLQASTSYQQNDQDGMSIFATQTAQGIHSGCYYGLSAMIDGICNKMEQTLQQRVNRILCGGDATHIYMELQSRPYVLKPDLVMSGLQLIAHDSFIHKG
jgi:type III pantothenate kinase